MAKRDGRCPSCGGTRWINAVDNFGQPYTGCANCVLVLEPKLRPRRLPVAAPGEG